MPNPVAYNSTTPPSGGFQRATITYGLSGSNYGANSPGGLTYYNSLPTSSAWVIVSDSYTLGLSTQGNAKPVMWSTGSASTGSLIRLINGLPSMTSSFTDYYSAVNWLQSTNKYFLLNNGYENIVTDGLVLNLDAGWWNSYPTINTTWYDLSGANRNGTLANGISFNSANSGSLVLDGADDEITFTGVNFGALSAFTICGFVKPTLSGDPSGTIANNSNSSSPYGWHCRFNSLVSFWIGTDGSLTHYDGIALTDNQWNFFAVTVNSTTITHYKNGVANNTYSGTFNTFVTNNAPFRMGRWEGGSYYYTGNIGNFCYYNRALTATEVLQNYNAQKGRFGL